MASIVRSIDPLVVGRVIGEVVDMFVPMADLRVQYGTKHIFNGCEIKPSLAIERPLVHIPPLPSNDNLYSLVCIISFLNFFLLFLNFEIIALC